MAIQYSGGTYVNTTFTGDTKANINSNIQTQLTAAGWSVVSGSGTTNLLMQTAAASGSGNQGRVRFKDNGGSCIQVSIENVGSSVASASATNSGGHLLPAAAKTFRIIATKFHFFCFTPGSSAAREFVMAGILWVPTFLHGVLNTAIYMSSNSLNDSSSTTGASFRTSLKTSGSGVQCSNQATIMNAGLYQKNDSSGTHTADVQLVVTHGANLEQFDRAYRWHDNSLMIVEPLFAVGAAVTSDEAVIRGQLYDCCVIIDSFSADVTTSFSDSGTSHNFWCITSANTGSSNNAKGSLFVATS